MELDEFKSHWNALQDKVLQQQQLSPEKLTQIIMTTTDTVSKLHAKSMYWKKMGNIIIPMLAVMVVINWLMAFIKGTYLHQSDGMLSSIVCLIIMALYCIVTVWIYKRQEQIFTIYNSDNVKETLKQIIGAFKRFYLLYNIIYLFLYPAYFYAVITLLMPYWHPSRQTVFITCAVATAVSFIVGHWYYRVKFLNKLKSLEANLEQLEG